MTRAKNILAKVDEGLSEILYHRTSVWRAIEILRTNTFKLTSSLGSPSDTGDANTGIKWQPPGKYYYLSAMRTPASRYMDDLTLVLDGKKFAERYKGGPVDYWNMRTHTGNPSSEFEDRVWSPDREIPNAVKYIKAIHVDVSRQDSWGLLKKLMAVAGDIPVYSYTNKAAYRNLQWSKAERVDPKKFVTTGKSMFGTKSQHDLDFKFPRWVNKDILKLQALLSKHPDDKLSYEEDSFLRTLSYTPTYLDSAISNARRPNGDAGLEAITALMRKNRLNSTEELRQFLLNKFGAKVGLRV